MSGRPRDLTAADWPVGARVWIRSVNRRADEEGTIVKVGRTLVHVKGRWETRRYRIDTGVISDGYGHDSIETNAMRQTRLAYEADLRVLAWAGLRPDYSRGRPDPAALAAAAAAIRDFLGDEDPT
jgi:hypothetical protein